ncbi:MAG: hypothetical protein J7623_30420 [Chitinophaga sp.]|uniref:hypothetical protein n=1 Tax=Chitinophaga sp. TaxID=1869181 RepID=UPI001B21E966|nr:hypothetical protein [Chitinophaga sp.]MBO9732996.1 hypothetical protein [Chitinophaga sp.]
MTTNSAIVPNKSKPPYLLGLLGLIPLVGAFVGVALILYAILKYQDKWLAIIGAACITLTVIFYSALFYATTHADVFRKGFADIEQKQLVSVIKSIEFYKLSHGQYPDSLQQLLKDDELTPIYDGARGMKMTGRTLCNYQKIGDKYTLFSSGQDGIPHTKDDLFPLVTITDSSKIGLISAH